MKKIQFNFKTILFLLALFAFLVPSSYAQKKDDDENGDKTNELNLPSGENKGIAREKYTLLIDAVNNKQFEEAVDPLNWILENAPNMHADVYVKAVKLYDGLAKKAEEEGRDSEVKVNQEKIAEMYKMRIKNGLADDMSDIYHRFGLDAYFYWKDDPAKIDTLYHHYEKTYQLDRDHFSRSEVIYYADAAGKEYEQELISLEKLTEVYEELKSYVAGRIAKEETQEEKDKWKSYVLDKIDELELIYFPKDCNRIADLFGEKLKANSK